MASKSEYPEVKHFHVGSKDRVYFTSNLAILLRSGVSISEAIFAMQQTTKSRKLQAALVQMQHDIDEGMALWQVLQRSSIVSEQTLVLVQLGEESGNLPENLSLASMQEAKQRLFAANIQAALLYPTFVILTTFIVAIGVAWFLLPRLAETFSQLRTPIPLITQIFLNFGVFLQKSGAVVMPLIILGAIVTAYILFGFSKTKHLGRSLLIHLPGIGNLLRETEVARFGYLLGTLLDAGLSITRACQLLARATNSPIYNHFYKYLFNAFEEGYNFATSFSRYRGANKIIPPAVQQLIMAGERSGALPDTLKSIGSIYEENAALSTKNLQSVLEPILLVIIATGVLSVAVAVVLPIYSLVGGLGV